jgi:acyl carrier protein
MTKQDIFASFAETIEDFSGVPADDVTLTADLVDDLGIDSLTMVEIIVSAQEKFSIEIPDADLMYLKTVQDIVSYVDRVQRDGVSA